MPQDKTILIIEDDEGIRETLRLILEPEGFRVFTANNGQEGLDCLAKIPDLGVILLDLMMPVMNGWEFLEELDELREYRELPVIVVTAFAEKAQSIRHAKAILKKPIEIDALLGLVNEHCHAYT